MKILALISAMAATAVSFGQYTLFSTGFEGYSGGGLSGQNGWNANSTYSVDTPFLFYFPPTFEGNRAVYCDTTGNTAGSKLYMYHSATTSPPGGGMWENIAYVRLVNQGLTGVNNSIASVAIWALDNTGNNLAEVGRLAIDHAGNVNLYGSTVVSTSIAVRPGTTQYHKLEVVADLTQDKLWGYVDGVLKAGPITTTVSRYVCKEADYITVANGTNTIYYDNVSLSGTPDKSGYEVFNGRLFLNNWSLNDYSGTAQILLEDGSDVSKKFFANSIHVDPLGFFSFDTSKFSGLQSGHSYFAYVKMGHWLRKSIGTIGLFGNGITWLPTVGLTNGDCDGNNAVTIVDYSILSDAFNAKTGDANYDTRADLDGNGLVNIIDYSILSDNFNLVGDGNS